MSRRIRHLGRWIRDRTGGGDAGQVTPFAVLLSVALIAVAGLVLDAGIALSTKVQALDIAQSAARAGAQQLDLYAYRTRGVTQLDTGRAAVAARSWLASAGVAGDASATATTVTVTVRRDQPHPDPATRRRARPARVRDRDRDRRARRHRPEHLTSSIQEEVRA